MACGRTDDVDSSSKDKSTCWEINTAERNVPNKQARTVNLTPNVDETSCPPCLRKAEWPRWKQKAVRNLGPEEPTHAPLTLQAHTTPTDPFCRAPLSSAPDPQV